MYEDSCDKYVKLSEDKEPKETTLTQFLLVENFARLCIQLQTIVSSQQW